MNFVLFAVIASLYAVSAFQIVARFKVGDGASFNHSLCYLLLLRQALAFICYRMISFELTGKL
jgi:hypothetical protein